MTQTTADPTLGIAWLLADDAKVNAMTAGRIFRPELPEGEDDQMPRACVVARPAGGGAMFGRGNLPVNDPRIDCVCYGSTRLEAENLGREVERTLRYFKGPQRFGEGEPYGPVKVYWCRIAGGVASAIQPDVNWPFALVSVQAMVSTNTIT